VTAARHGAIVLAAGGSSRLGRPKQLLELGGEPLVRRAARAAAEAAYAPIVVVVGAEEAAVRRALESGAFAIAVNERWKTGIASSIRAGIEALLAQRPDAEGALLAACDQPLVGAAHLALLAGALGGGKAIAASSYGGTAGVPALFAREVFPELLALEGDRGAKRVIASDPARVAVVDLPGGERDVDTEKDWSTLADPG
jgi:molybdenum cofactor cytidylyltransferase